MSTALLLLILLAAFIHALWNFFAKKTGGSLTVLWLGALMSTLLVTPLAIGVQWGHPFATRGLWIGIVSGFVHCAYSVSYTHLRAHETGRNLVCRLLLEKKKN